MYNKKMFKGEIGYAMLNIDQKIVVDTVLEAVDNSQNFPILVSNGRNEDIKNAFFVDGPGN